MSDSRYSRLLLISEEQGFMLPLFVLGPWLPAFARSFAALKMYSAQPQLSASEVQHEKQETMEQTESYSIV